MTHLHIHLLGRFQISENGQPVAPFTWAQIQALLAYLLLHRESPVPRQQLAFLLWPDSSEAQARTNLRVLLHRLRKDFPTIASFIHLERTSVGWRHDAPYTLDLAAFEAALARAEAATDLEAREHLEAAAAAYVGDLLPDHYEDWILVERERLHNHYVSALAQLTHLLETERRYAEAIAYAQQLLAADPLREASHRRLMQLHAADNDRAAAL